MEQRAQYPQMDPKLQAQHGGRSGEPQSNSLNIIQQADSAKNLSDQQIRQAFQSGQFMPYILLAEMQNRKAVRAEAQSEAASNTTTVAEDLMGGQDRNVDLANAPQADPSLQQMHGGRAGVEGIPGAQQQPAAYAEGGIVGYADGGEIVGELLRLVRTGRITLGEVLAKLNLDPSSPEAAEVAREFESILADQTISEDDRKVGVGGPYGGRDDEGLTVGSDLGALGRTDPKGTGALAALQGSTKNIGPDFESGVGGPIGAGRNDAGPTVGSDLGALGRTDPKVAEGLAALQASAPHIGGPIGAGRRDKGDVVPLSADLSQFNFDPDLSNIYKRSQSTDPDGPGVLRRLQDEAKRARSLGDLRPPGMKDAGPTVGSDLGALGRTDPEVAEGLAAFQEASQTGPNVVERGLDKNMKVRDDTLSALGIEAPAVRDPSYWGKEGPVGQTIRDPSYWGKEGPVGQALKGLMEPGGITEAISDPRQDVFKGKGAPPPLSKPKTSQSRARDALIDLGTGPVDLGQLSPDAVARKERAASAAASIPSTVVPSQGAGYEDEFRRESKGIADPRITEDALRKKRIDLIKSKQQQLDQTGILEDGVGVGAGAGAGGEDDQLPLTAEAQQYVSDSGAGGEDDSISGKVEKLFGNRAFMFGLNLWGTDQSGFGAAARKAAGEVVKQMQTSEALEWKGRTALASEKRANAMQMGNMLTAQTAIGVNLQAQQRNLMNQQKVLLEAVKNAPKSAMVTKPGGYDDQLAEIKTNLAAIKKRLINGEAQLGQYITRGTASKSTLSKREQALVDLYPEK